ncbi:unnamed protein product, partial [marine sediment metagenome]
REKRSQKNKDKRMTANSGISKKWGIVGIAIAAMVALADKTEPLAYYAFFGITIVTIVYLIVQGLIDKGRE